MSKKSSERLAFSYSSGRREKEVRQMLECDVIEIIDTESLIPAEHLLLKIAVEAEFVHFIGHHRLYSIYIFGTML